MGVPRPPASGWRPPGGRMYKQLRRAVKVAGGLKLWWRATNGILQGCPLSVILVNVLTTVWKWDIDSLCRQVCVATVALPPALGEADSDPEDGQWPPEPPPLVTQVAGYAALGSSGCADDTHAVAMGAAALQATTSATTEWLRVRGQDVRVDNSCS